MSPYIKAGTRLSLSRSLVVSTAAVLLPWTALGLLSSLELHLESAFSPRQNSWAYALLLELSFTSICALMTPGVVALSRRFRIDQKPYWPNALLHLVASAIFTLVAKSIWYPMMIALQGRQFSWSKFSWSIIYSFDYCMVLYWAVLLVAYLIDYYRRYQRGRVDAMRLNAELAQAQLRWLKSRLHPHFLFNALNTISALVREDPGGAERMIARLGELLRLALHDSAMQEVPLSRELRYLDLYLDIEHTRFQDRLSVRFDIEPETGEALVPGLLLQPLVENAIRHGIGSTARGGEIRITAARDADRLALSVCDNGRGLPPEDGRQPREGVGLSSVRGRLERLYGRNHSMVLRNQPGGGVEARITIPFLRPASEVQEEFDDALPHVSGR